MNRFKKIKKSFAFFFMVSLLFAMTGCGKESQFTQIDDKYKTTVQQGVPDDSTATPSESSMSQADHTEQSDSTKEPEQDDEKNRKASKNAKEEKDRLSDKTATPKDKEASKKESSSQKKDPKATAKSTKNTSKKNTKKSKTAKADRTKKSSDRTDVSAVQNENKKEDASLKTDTKDAEQKKDQNQTTAEPEEDTCTISIDCKTILANKSNLKKTKAGFVPGDGVVLKSTEVAIKKNDTVYDILSRVCKEQRIHMDANYTPVYKTYYVRGIHQLYEMDCGDLSGWTYQVNGVVPNYGCSKYTVKAGDVIAWRYTCDGGKDVR